MSEVNERIMDKLFYLIEAFFVNFIYKCISWIAAANTTVPYIWTYRIVVAKKEMPRKRGC